MQPLHARVAARLQHIYFFYNSAATDLFTRCNLVACNNQRHRHCGTASDSDKELLILTFIQWIFHKRKPKKRHDTTRHDTTRHDTTRHDTTRHDTTRHDTTRHDTTRHDTTRHDTTRREKTWHGNTWHGKTGGEMLVRFAVLFRPFLGM